MLTVVYTRSISLCERATSKLTAEPPCSAGGEASAASVFGNRPFDNWEVYTVLLLANKSLFFV